MLLPPPSTTEDLSSFKEVIGCKFFSDEDLATAYFEYGNESLLRADNQVALESYREALIHANSIKENSEGIKFFIYLGMSVAHDCLGNNSETKVSIENLLKEIEIIGESLEESEQDISNENKAEAIEYMEKIAILAPSPSVQSFLFLLFNEFERSIKEESEERVMYAGYLDNNRDFSIGYPEIFHAIPSHQVEQCVKGFWKNVKKYGKKTGKVVRKAVNVVKAVKEVSGFIADLIDDIKGKKEKEK